MMTYKQNGRQQIQRQDCSKAHRQPRSAPVVPPPPKPGPVSSSCPNLSLCAVPTSTGVCVFLLPPPQPGSVPRSHSNQGLCSTLTLTRGLCPGPNQTTICVLHPPKPGLVLTLPKQGSASRSPSQMRFCDLSPDLSQGLLLTLDPDKGLSSSELGSISKLQIGSISFSFPKSDPVSYPMFLFSTPYLNYDLWQKHSPMSTFLPLRGQEPGTSVCSLTTESNQFLSPLSVRHSVLSSSLYPLLSPPNWNSRKLCHLRLVLQVSFRWRCVLFSLLLWLRRGENL